MKDRTQPRRVPEKRLLLAALLAALLGACPSSPEPKERPGPDEPARPSPVALLAETLEKHGKAGQTPDPEAVVQRIETVIPASPAPLLQALAGGNVLLENAQIPPEPETIRELGAPPPAEGRIDILQKILLDGGDGVFELLYLHRVGAKKDGRKTAPKEDPPGKGGKIVDSWLLRARFTPLEEMLDLPTALARLKSRDWRTALSAPEALTRDLGRELSELENRALDLLASAAGNDRRARFYLDRFLQTGTSPSKARARAEELGKNVANAYIDWFAGNGERSAWEKPLGTFLRMFDDGSLPWERRIEALRAGLGRFGHGSGLPKYVTSIDNPKSFVKVLSPLLQEWFETKLQGGPPASFLASLALLEGADPFLKVRLLQKRKTLLFAALLDGLAKAPPALALASIRGLEEASGAVFPAFDPLADDPARARAVERMKERLARTGFGGRGEEIERKRRLASVERAFETLAFKQRAYRSRIGTFCADVGSLFGQETMAEAAGFLRAETGGWKLKHGFTFSLRMEGGGFTAEAKGPLADGAPETTFRYDSAVGRMEILPDDS